MSTPQAIQAVNQAITGAAEAMTGQTAELLTDLPVNEVIVLEDRAQVLRRGTVRLGTGDLTLRLPGVAPVLSDRTLTASLPDGAAGLRITDTRVSRQLRPVEERRATPAGVIERELLDRRAEREHLVRRKQLLQGQLSLVEQTAEKTMADISSDAAWNRRAPDEWRGWLEQLAGQERELRDGLLRLGCELEDVEEELEDLRRRAQATDRPDLQLTADIIIEMISPDAGEVTVEVGYVVPLACWRPLHTARLVEGEGEAAQVELQTDACIWQCTGEDWSNVRVQLSTQRPSLGLEPPLLSEDVLRTRPRAEDVVVATREQEVRTTGLGREQRIADELPGIDDGGSALTMAGCHRATIPSDGRPYRVPISSFVSPAVAGLVLMPELVAAPVRKVTLSNRGSCPLLAGPVDLIAGNGLVGRAPLLFVAPGERFALGFGPDPAVRVRRKCEQVKHEAGALSRYEQTDHTVTLLLCNIGSRARELEMCERMPVSEVEQVVVQLDRDGTSPGASGPDDNGFVTWPVSLDPGATRTMHLRYSVKKRKGVVSE